MALSRSYPSISFLASPKHADPIPACDSYFDSWVGSPSLKSVKIAIRGWCIESACFGLLLGLLVVYFLQQVEGESTSEDINSETFDGSAGNIKFSSPSLTDDDDSIMLPKSVKCDGCLSLAYQIVEAFDKSHSKKKSVKILPETDVLDILDTLCNSKFDRMGLKNVGAATKLSGPGLETAGEPGMIMSGGRWPQRMRYLCGNIVGEFGEEEIYDNYLFNRDNMGDVLCRGKGVTNSCIDPKNKQNSGKAKRKDEF